MFSVISGGISRSEICVELVICLDDNLFLSLVSLICVISHPLICNPKVFQSRRASNHLVALQTVE